MESQLGCKANGLATAVLFGQGLPGSETIDSLMHNIDEQLGETNKQSVFVCDLAVNTVKLYCIKLVYFIERHFYSKRNVY